MSFLAEVGLGINVGEAIVNGTLKYSKHQYQAKINELQRLFNSLATHQSNLENLRERFKQLYTGDQAERLLKNINTQLAAVKNAMEDVTSQTEVWQNAINEMEETVGAQQQKLDEITNILGKLDIQE